MNVVVLGASPNRNRYSNKAVRALQEHGQIVIPVNPNHAVVEGIPVTPSLDRVSHPIDTVCVYLSPRISLSLKERLTALQARRWIFNPGTECLEVEDRLRAQGAEVLRACTLVLLSLGKF